MSEREEVKSGEEITRLEGATEDNEVLPKPLENLESGESKPMSKRKGIIIGAVAAAVVLALAGGGAAIALNQSKAAEDPIVQEDNAAAVKATYEVTLRVNAPDWATTSTPVIAHIVSEDGKIDFYHAFAANADTTIKLKPGYYSITYISPINADGSIYKTNGALIVGVEAGKGDVSKSESNLERIPADQVTQEQMDAVLSGIRDAVSKGDSTLSGDAGKKVVDQAATNASKAPNVDKAKVEQVAEQAKQEVTDTPTASTGSNGNTNSGNTGNAGSNSSTTTPTGGSNSGGGSASGGNSGGGSTTPETPAHTHNWVAQTSQQWVPNVVWVQDSAAWDEPVMTGSVVQASCGLTFNTTEEWGTHKQEMGRGHTCSYSLVPTYGTIHHDATGHSEDQGSYDTQTTGYVCSGCGASK